ncbi:hypothetical protein [Streptomyces sedi]|uniref:MFS transporter n=1 Tax=Streptomyces sedi TaxID=555059 RepID=A0A5C4UVP2_9ACTN|nr:hypothetical protein [Streptomyces sedi]TNM27741.1 hypothetical protein FH715_20255 [Streptomyces sedi]
MLRATRAAVFSALCVVLAISSHTATSGDSVSWRLLPVVWAGIWIGVWSFTERERGPVAVIAATLGTQLLLHGAFSLGHAVNAARLSPAPHAGHAAPGGHLAPAVDSGHGLLDGSWAMTVGHVVMALVSAVWLWRGERALFALLRWAAHRVLGPPPRPARPPGPAAPAGLGPTREGPLAPLACPRPLGSRGPPARPAFPAALRRSNAARHGRARPV